MNPRWPIYVVSKGRWDSRMTVKSLEAMHVPYHVIVEEQEHASYAKVIDPAKLLVLDPAYQRDYDACCSLRPRQSKGSGPARNFAWDHTTNAGAEWHWCADDNIMSFLILNKNMKIMAGDGLVFRAMEDFSAKFSNVAMSGPQYEKFAPRKSKLPPFVTNTRVYSCNLIRTAVPFRWRGRWNEDTDLSLRMLKAGWCTVLFNAFLQKKVWTMTFKGGNTDEVYADGTLLKSRMLEMLHPDVARVVWKFQRWHHHVDYSGFKQPLIAVEKSQPARSDYRMQLLNVLPGTTYAKDWRGRVVPQEDNL